MLKFFTVIWKSLDELGYRILTTAASRLSGRATAGIALLLYAGVGLGLPLALGWSIFGLVLANALATMLAGLVIITWLQEQFGVVVRYRLLEWTTDLRRLDAREFEWLVGELFRREGWKVQRTGSQDRPDGNIDLNMVRDGQRAIVQCKRWESWLVGVKEVREFGGTLRREGLTKRRRWILRDAFAV